MIDTTASTPSLPLAMEDFLMPGLAEADVAGVDDLTDAHLSEPTTPIRKLHPKRRVEKQGYDEVVYLFNHFINLIFNTNHFVGPKLLRQCKTKSSEMQVSILILGLYVFVFPTSRLLFI